MKKIISVKFDDGTERRVSDNDLKRYVERADSEQMLDGLCGPLSGYASRSAMMETVKAIQEVLRQEKSKTNKDNASKPKKDFTKAEVLQFKSQYQGNYPDAKRGWMTAACIHFKTTTKTLKNRLME